MTGEDYEAAKPVPARSRVTGDPWQRDHLPECLEPFSPEQCICSELRACEQRVLRDAVNSDAVRAAIRMAHSDGVQAARDAVASVPREDGGYCHVLHACDVEAAIDALRDERNGSRNDGGG